MARRRNLLCGVAGLFMPVLAGCQGAIQGDWHMIEAVPSKQVFNLDDATFRPDGTYTATTTFEGRTNTESGTYEFNGFKLKLEPKGGGLRTYTASLQMGRMELADGQRHVTLAKGKKGH